MTELAELVLRDTAALGVLSGGLVFVLLEVAKLCGWSDPGKGKAKKVLAAVVLAAIVTAARQQVAGEWDVAGLVSGVVSAWLVAAGIHGTRRAQIKHGAMRLK